MELNYTKLEYRFIYNGLSYWSFVIKFVRNEHL